VTTVTRTWDGDMVTAHDDRDERMSSRCSIDFKSSVTRSSRSCLPCNSVVKLSTYLMYANIFISVHLCANIYIFVYMYIILTAMDYHPDDTIVKKSSNRPVSYIQKCT